MKNALIICSLFVLSSCGSYQYDGTYGQDYHPESIESKIQRFEGKSQFTNKMPKLEIGETLFPTNNRVPASLGSKPRTKEQEKIVDRLSSSRIYFMAFYDQYKKLNSYVGNTQPFINSCPYFHSDMVKTKSYESRYPAKQWSKTYPPKQEVVDDLKNYPEFYLHLENSNVWAKWNESNESPDSFVQAGLINYLAGSLQELQELCEFGNSNNSYLYRNLISHVKSHPSEQKSQKALGYLLKSPIVMNWALIESLKEKSQGRTIASETKNYHWDYEAIERLDAKWVGYYFEKFPKQPLNT